MRLFYRVVPHNGGIVFATPRRAEYIARIHHAISRSRTWAEFRKAMPKTEYSRIMQIFDFNGEARPRSTNRFVGGSIRPPLAVERLERLSGVRLAYRMKTPSRDGTTHVLINDGELV